MHKKELLKLFESVLDNAGFNNKEDYKDKLHQKLGNKRYDTQDIALIELLLKDDREEFCDNYYEVLQNNILERKDIENYKDTDECIEETVKHFIQSLEHSIDYYYNSIIAKHFSSS